MIHVFIVSREVYLLMSSKSVQLLKAHLVVGCI